MGYGGVEDRMRGLGGSALERVEAWSPRTGEDPV